VKPKILLALAAGLCAASFPGDGLSAKLRDWPKSPEAYFPTAEERSQWKSVKTDSDADAFVAAYYARRPADLPAILKERIGVADKYFSDGKVKGSETLRGKVIILFGPPSKIESTDASGSMGRAGTVDRGEVTSGVADPHSNVGPGVAGLSGSTHDPIFSILYDEKAAPKAIGKAFRVDLKMKGGGRQEAVKTEDLEEKFEAVAKASIVKKDS